MFDSWAGKNFRGHDPTAEVSTQWFQNTKLPMLNKNLKLSNAIHKYQGVTSHHWH